MEKEIIFEEFKNADGTNGSPKLPEGKINFLVDIDGTICDDIPNEEPWRIPTAKEIASAKDFVNSKGLQKMFDEK